jgi:hypothetical protein
MRTDARWKPGVGKRPTLIKTCSRGLQPAFHTCDIVKRGLKPATTYYDRMSEYLGSAARHSASGAPISRRTIFVPRTNATVL